MATRVAVALLALTAYARAQSAGAVAAADFKPGEYARAYAAVALGSPVDYIQVDGLSIDRAGGTSDGTGYRLDFAEFKIAESTAFLSGITGTSFAYYTQSAPSSANGFQATSASAFGFLLRFTSVVEYVEKNGQSGFQYDPLYGIHPDSDQIVGTYDLTKTSVQWKGITYRNETHVNTDGQQFLVHYMNATTTDNVFSFSFVLSGSPVKLSNGIRLSPNSAKIDLQINWFNNPAYTGPRKGGLFGLDQFATGPSSNPDSRIAVVAAFAAASGSASYGTDPDTNQPYAKFASDDYAGYFRWVDSADTVTANGIGAAGVGFSQSSADGMLTSAFGGWVATLGAWSFDAVRPDSIYWDPEIGADISPQSSSAFMAAPSVALLVAALFAIVNRW
jgi:hypothetical protein